MFNYIQSFSRKTKLSLLIGSWVLFFLSFSLFLSGVIDDGYNEFAKLFNFKGKEEVVNPDYEIFSNYLIDLKKTIPDLKDSGLILRELGITPLMEITVYKQNSLAMSWFGVSMILLCFISLSVGTSLAFITYRSFKRNIKIANDENLIDDDEFNLINKVVGNAQKRDREAQKELFRQQDLFYQSQAKVIEYEETEEE